MENFEGETVCALDGELELVVGSVVENVVGEEEGEEVAILLRFDHSQNIVAQVSIWEPIIFENCIPTDRILSCRNEITSCDQCDAYTPDFSCGIHKPGRLSSFQSSKAIGAQEWLFHICWERLDGSRQLIQN